MVEFRISPSLFLNGRFIPLSFSVVDATPVTPSLSHPVSDRLTKFYGPPLRIFYVSSILDFTIARAGKSWRGHGRIKQRAGFLYYFRVSCAGRDDLAERSDRAVTIGGIKLQSRSGGNVISSVRCRLVRRIRLDVGARSRLSQWQYLSLSLSLLSREITWCRLDVIN